MKGTIRFEIREDKILKSGKAPIGIIYSVKGQRKRYSIGQAVYPANWDAKEQKALYLPKNDPKIKTLGLSADSILTQIEINDVNSELKGFVSQIEKIEREFIKDQVPFSSEMVVGLLRGVGPEVLKTEEANKFIFQFIDKYLADHSATRVKGSLGVYRALKTHLEAYEKHHKKRVVFADIDPKFFQSFQNFLIEHRNLANTTVAKQLRTLKTFLGYARMNGVEINERYKDFKVKRDKLDVFALTLKEFYALWELDLSNNKRLSQVRDVFCFSCVTGLRYSDLRALRREHIKEAEIIITVTKTKELLHVPLSKYSKEILDRYANQYYPLPVIAAANMNLYVKELGKKAGINEPTEKVRYKGPQRVSIVKPKYSFITVHTGRKTFVTNSLTLGMSAEEVMECTGHKDHRSFARYVLITEEQKKKVLTKAWGNPND